MAEIIFCGTPKRASTVQRRVRSTESYALVRSMNHAYNRMCFFRANSCSGRITNIIFGCRTVRSETTLFLRQDPHALAVFDEAASDNLKQYFAGARYQRDAPVVAALCPILILMEYDDDDISPLLRHLALPPNTDDDIEQSPAQGGITIEGDLEQLNGDSVRCDSLCFRQRADGACQPLHRGLNS